MNVTEKLALKWMRQNGYGSIKFRSRETPDFLTDNGGVEVKLADKHMKITFLPGQEAKLAGSTILVYRRDGTGPTVCTLDSLEAHGFKTYTFHQSRVAPELRTCINCGYGPYVQRIKGAPCPKCHGDPDQKGRGQNWRKGMKNA